MKPPPPFLLFAALLFWGWQSQEWLVGAVTGAALEAAVYSRWRWALEDVEFNRIWNFCVLLVVTMAAYVFTTNEPGGGLAGLQHGAVLHNASVSSTQTATTVMRWLPLTLLPIFLAQIFNERRSIPLAAVSLLVRRRQQRDGVAAGARYLDISYLYFMVCLFSAGVHANEGSFGYFWGLSVLILWALWSLRSQRYGMKIWAGALFAVLLIGFLGQMGISRAERMVQNYNAQWLARFLRNRTDPLQSATRLGQIGELKMSPRIVVRLEPRTPGAVPEYLREASYRHYHSPNRTWVAGGTKNDFNNVLPEPDNTTWVLVPDKTNGAVINLACYLNDRSKEGDPQGLLPLPSGCCRLENLPAESSVISLEINQLGAALVTGAGLMLFDARFGPGTTLDSPPDRSTNQFDLKIPAEETNALAQVIGEMKLSGTNTTEILPAVTRFFADKFAYSTWQGPDKLPGTNTTALSRFLLTSRSGHCEYFATATVLLLRQLGIPARYAVGYYVHERSGSGYLVRERDAHAWCLLWNGRNWQDFDTTPGSGVTPGNSSVSFGEWFADFSSWIGFQFAKFRWGQTHLRPYLLWTFAPLLTGLLYYILFQRRKKSRSGAHQVSAEIPVVWPGHDSAFYRLEKTLAARGLPRSPGEPLSRWLERVLAKPALTGQRAALTELLQLHYRYRFDPRGLSPAEKVQLGHNVDALLAVLSSPK